MLTAISSDALANAIFATDNEIYASIANGAYINSNLLAIVHKGEHEPNVPPIQIPGGTTIFCSSDVAVALLVAHFVRFDF